MSDLEVGKTYIAPLQGTGITPRGVKVTVVWVDQDGDAVHYRKEGDPSVHQTTIGRFKEIIGGVR